MPVVPCSACRGHGGRRPRRLLSTAVFLSAADHGDLSLTHLSSPIAPASPIRLSAAPGPAAPGPAPAGTAALACGCRPCLERTAAGKTLPHPPDPAGRTRLRFAPPVRDGPADPHAGRPHADPPSPEPGASCLDARSSTRIPSHPSPLATGPSPIKAGPPAITADRSPSPGRSARNQRRPPPGRGPTRPSGPRSARAEGIRSPRPSRPTPPESPHLPSTAPACSTD